MGCPIRGLLCVDWPQLQGCPHALHHEPAQESAHTGSARPRAPVTPASSSLASLLMAIKAMPDVRSRAHDHGRQCPHSPPSRPHAQPQAEARVQFARRMCTAWSACCRDLLWPQPIPVKTTGSQRYSLSTIECRCGSHAGTSPEPVTRARPALCPPAALRGICRLCGTPASES